MPKNKNSTSKQDKVKAIGYSSSCLSSAAGHHTGAIFYANGRVQAIAGSDEYFANLYVQHKLAVPQHFVRCLKTEVRDRLALKKTGGIVKPDAKRKVIYTAPRPSNYAAAGICAAPDIAKMIWEAEHSLQLN